MLINWQISLKKTGKEVIVYQNSYLCTPKEKT